MAGKKKLVIQHLEDISWKVLEEYPKVIKGMIHGKAGVYALYRRKKLYYIGLATNLMTRLKGHLKDRHNGEWDRFSVYLTIHDGHVKELESLLLRIVNPTGNKTKGKFAKSDNLRSLINKNIKSADADKRALLVGGSVVRRRRRVKTKESRGTKALAGIVERRISLRTTYLGEVYRATLRKDGRISFDKKIYDSPSGAAKAVTGRSSNGWHFWKYKNDKGEWVRLREIRK